MAGRLKLQEELCSILGTRNVYYNPPESVNMKYPGIKYSRSGINTNRANDAIYKSTDRYQVIVIDPDSDGTIGDMILTHFPMCSFDRAYKANGLNHNVYTLYY